MIYGSNYADTINGGAGNDLLIGQGGADLFAFSASEASADIITDFVDGSDMISLAGLGYSAASVGSAMTIGGGANAVITFNSGGFAGGSITLLNVNQSLITASDFQF